MNYKFVAGITLSVSPFLIVLGLLRYCPEGDFRVGIVIMCSALLCTTAVMRVCRHLASSMMGR